ncbi:MAG: regulator of cell morphogenesis and NO signaling [Marinoscillum sp.]|jgi:regulator of cell morphogenesis and NO signaling
MENLEKLKVGKIVSLNFRTSKVFYAHDIDFCCGGGLTLEEACKKRKVPLEQVVQELNESFRTDDAHNYDEISATDLIKNIVSIHHKYVETTAPALLTYLDKLCGVHGDKYPELFIIRDLFKGVAKALAEHMKKEELILFPFIQAMDAANASNFPLSKPHFGNINIPIEMMELEHTHEGDRFREISRLTNRYTCPPDGCQTFHVTYALLQNFEEDLHKHIHLENNILFQKAQEMYDQFDFQ